MIIVSLLFGFAASFAIYLASSQQRLLARPRMARVRLRTLATVFAAAALTLAVRALGAGAGFFCCLSAIMFACAALPYLALLSPPAARA